MIDLNDNLHFINEPILTDKRRCKICLDELELGVNWSENRKNKYHYVCNKCERLRSIEYTKQLPITTKMTQQIKNSNISLLVPVALMITQQFFCTATGIDLIDNLNFMSLEHLKPKNDGGNWEYNNLVFVDEQINLAKNGYSIERTFNVWGRAFPMLTQENIDYAIQNFKNNNARVHEEFETVYKKLINMFGNNKRIYKPDRIKLELLLSSKISIKDLLIT